MQSVQYFFLSLLFIPIMSTAQVGYQLGQPTMIGNGCPSGSASVAISPDGSAISILFDQFTIEGKVGGNQWDKMRKNCRFQIPVSVTPGYMLETVQVEYRGFAHVMNGNRAFIITTGPSVGLSDMVVGGEKTRNELRNQSGDFYVQQRIPSVTPRCQVNNSIDFSVFLQLFGQAPRAPLYLREEATLLLASSDVIGEASPIRFQVRLRPCI